MAKSYMSREAALLRMQRYCAFQDRCHQEVRRKLLDLGIYGDDLEEIIVQLIEDRFLDEERFARAYARGKFQIKGWGRIRIIQELKSRQISAYCQRKALEEIEETQYREKLTQMLSARMSLDELGLLHFQDKQALAQFALRKGYEPDLIWEILRKLTDKCT